MAEKKKEKEKKQPVSLKALASSLNKTQGKGTATLGKDVDSVKILCSTGSFALDLALGLGGLPKSRMIEYYGQESGGKTTISLITAVEVQKLGLAVGFIDLEGTFDPDWFKALGGSLEEDDFIYIRPDDGGDAFQAMEEMLNSKLIDIIILDSVATMVTEAEMEGDFDEARMTQLARLMSESLKKINSTMLRLVKKEGECASIIFINQTRDKVGNNQRGKITSGGNALRFYCTIRVDIARIGGADGMIGDKESPSGFHTRLKVMKNKVGPPFRQVITPLYIEKPKVGIDINAEIFDLAVHYDVIEKRVKDKATGEYSIDPEGKGAWYLISDDEADHIYGRAKAIEHFLSNKELFEKVKGFTISIVTNKAKDEEKSFNAQESSVVKTKTLEKVDEITKEQEKKGIEEINNITKEGLEKVTEVLEETVEKISTRKSRKSIPEPTDGVVSEILKNKE